MAAPLSPVKRTAKARLAVVNPESEQKNPYEKPVASRGATESGMSPAQTANLLQDAFTYQVDLWQRSVLFLDTLRQRANYMFAHEAAGMPPPIDFDYELILDARRFEPPANYALLRITRCCEYHAENCVDDKKPPIIIIDPRAGHGPGIGGSKRASEVGMSLREGHPTYFVSFFPYPCENQTLHDVLKALRRFVEAVTERHGGTAPVVYGNCQAGWAAMLLAADCQGLAGPVVLNGSPLSYWAGESGVNPMRLAGGMVGGVWLTHLLADVGNGKFDGAWLVQNFENLNPANTLWEKNYQLFSHIDSERERFLEFERWWTGFYFLGREEILFIVENLFVGNKLERGQVKLCPGCVVDLKSVRSPLVVFASSEDNITPPHQALNWVPAVYPTTADLKQAGQRIIYLLNHHVGHLGIFVSADVARLEHRAILESLGEIQALPPGLYEMIIENPSDNAESHKPQFKVRFHERDVSEIRFSYPQKSFEKVQALSEQNEELYKSFVSPWITALANPFSAEALKWLHPMRMSRYMFSEQLNPWMIPVKALAPAVERVRRPASEDNVFVQTERAASKAIASSLKNYQESRDTASELLFARVFASQGSA